MGWRKFKWATTEWYTRRGKPLSMCTFSIGGNSDCTSGHPRGSSRPTRPTRRKWQSRNSESPTATCFRTVENGEILGYLESYFRLGQHGETCVCKSQEGVILRIDKTKFLKKLTSSDNNLPAIDQFMRVQMAARDQLIGDFETRHTQNPMFVRMMHTPASAKGRRVRT